MAFTHIATYQKVDAVFASAEEALQDKNSLYSPELKAIMEAWTNKIKDAGILLDGPTPTWDQGTFTLSMKRVISSDVDFRDSIDYDQSLLVAAAEQAGWTHIGAAIVES